MTENYIYYCSVRVLVVVTVKETPFDVWKIGKDCHYAGVVSNLDGVKKELMKETIEHFKKENGWAASSL